MTARPAGAIVEPEFSAVRLIAFIAMVFGMFMAILDIQIVSASLATIQAGVSASADEIAWVQTAYLIAEVVMIPLSGILSRAFSTRILFASSAGGFTLMSLLCATATDFNQLILWRALQGFIGGAMIPTVFAAAYSIFPRNKMSIVAPIVGLVATLAPTIGPTVGGYLTDLFSWRWLFLVNVGPGIVVTLATWLLVDFDRPNLAVLKNFDWAGLVSMALFLGALEYLLEEGPSKNWFDESLIVWATVASASGALVFFWRAFTAKSPIVDLTAFGNRNFWTGSLASFVLGVGLYGLTYVYPVYLARVRGFSPLQIGETMFITGLCQFIAAPIVGRLLNKVDLRLMIGLGFLGFAWGAAIPAAITKDWGFQELLFPQMLRGFSLMFMMVPINTLALGTMPPSKLKNASGLFNVTRNLGGAFGLAVINTTLNKRFDLHIQRLHEQLTWSNVQAQDFLAKLGAVYSHHGADDAMLAATRQLAAFARREALVMSLADVFVGMAFLFLFMAGITPIMRKPLAAPPPDLAH
ncbi:DHA2 family efflux MFS transporter permease subunit [Rhodoblastus sp.]|uniref:DHA2 family efflux MFS transporter permease subunit n=1 Tax=Rhodoblastus sp. TaxID=1962975 RepID=UPI0035AF25A7